MRGDVIKRVICECCNTEMQISMLICLLQNIREKKQMIRAKVSAFSKKIPDSNVWLHSSQQRRTMRNHVHFIERLAGSFSLTNCSFCFFFQIIQRIHSLLRYRSLYNSLSKLHLFGHEGEIYAIYAKSQQTLK